MALSSSPEELIAHPPTHPFVTLRGRWLMVGRALWGAFAILTLSMVIVGFPVRVGELGRTAASMHAELAQIGLTDGGYIAYHLVFEIAFWLGFTAVAVVVVWRVSHEWIALVGALMLVAMGALPATSTLARLAPFWRLPAQFVGYIAWTVIAIFFFLFPDGRFVPRWTRLLAIGFGVLQVPWAFFPGSVFDPDTWPPLLSSLMYISMWGSIGVAQIHRYKYASDAVQRQQTKWVVYGVTVAVLWVVGTLVIAALVPAVRTPGVAAVLYDLATYASICLVLLIPLSIGVATMRYRLWDIDPIVNRTLIYGALTISVIGIYVLIVGYLGAVFRTSSNLAVSLVATGVVAVLFQPLRERLQHGVNRLMYGERDDPYAVISRLGRRMEDTLAPEAVLPTLVETVAQALKLPYAAIALATTDHRPLTTDSDQNRERAPEGSTENRGLGDGSQSSVLGSPEAFAIVASSGTPVDKPLILPLVYQGETLGQLLLAPRAPGEAFSPADCRLLADLARQVGVAVHAVRLTADLQRLTADLQRSRERLVTTREEERRRLRRDLHDGLGPTLASLAQRIDTARGLVPRDPDAATALLGDLKTRIKATIAEIRRVAYALRPPALDELGLIPALREHAAHYDQANGLRVSLEAPEELSLLPAAVEVAAYRIVLEALTNVAQHAHAQTCRIRLSLADGLCLEITDDGRGLPAGSHAGVGLTAMRERAAELGGVCLIEPGVTGGTHVWARLPVPPPEV